MRLTPLSVHRLLLAAVLTAVKAVEDFRLSNRFWAKVGAWTWTR